MVIDVGVFTHGLMDLPPDTIGYVRGPHGIPVKPPEGAKIMAAVGGIVVPALFYLPFNSTGPGVVGWGIPMATDIAFAVGALSLLGSRVPKTLVTFLIALAIVDDLGAVADLGFASQPQDLLMAKTGILLASAIAGIGGISWLLANTKKTASGEP